MAHEQMGFHLPHGVEHHADHDQQTRAAKELRHRLRNRHGVAQNNWDDGDDRQKNGAVGSANGSLYPSKRGHFQLAEKGDILTLP